MGMDERRRVWVLGILVAAVAAVLPVAGQQRAGEPQALTAADYARAERFMSYNTTPLVLRSGVRPTWLPDGRFWYSTTTEQGHQAFLVDPATGGKSACDLPACKAAEAGRGGRGGRGGGRGGAARLDVPSPDGTHTAFIRDWNLWMRDVKTRKETQLTTDGVTDFGYATDNAGWTHSDRAILIWSPDSKKIATFQQDQRKVGEMYTVTTKVGHPELHAWKYPLPGDAVVTMIQRVIIDVDRPKVVRLQMPPDEHRSSLCDDVKCRGGEWADVYWSPDSTHLAFLSTARDHKKEQLRVADAATGAVRDVMQETVPTFFESGNGAVNWRYLPASNEILWFSERDNWGQLYLYDLQTGKLKNQITHGDGNVTQVLRVDEKNRLIYFLAVGKEAGENPYYTHLYRVAFDGSHLQPLTPEPGTHDVSFSPSGAYFVDTYSTPVTPPVSVLRDASGKSIATLEKADVSKLVATGWKPPVQFVVKARDGQTDLYGLMFEPTQLEPGRKYPIVNHIYPGPQTGSVGSRTFNPARGDAQALAELGFVVVEIDGMGTPWRSKKFHEAYYGNMGDNTLPDQVTAMKQLAQKYPFIDIDRAGIYGHSGGGFATADAMFRYPDFFKVGISESGNHDNRVYEDDWGEKWQGLLKKNPDGTTNYDNQANENVARNLKGHLLLAHGTIDDNVPPYNTLLVVDALIKANKDFDLLLLPNQHHGYASDSDYMTRRRWDYFVRYLLGAQPPAEYQMHAKAGAEGAGPR
ncbi:MAG TPA: DPP IV N-terminal domain-containing protein [Vicinamibacterales bacterium]|nr:DPP IV N-terminal domain-containing protein [Vicinamibacterales bacterium]